MTLIKGIALALAFTAAVALGVWIGPHITHRAASNNDATAVTTQQPAASIDNEQPTKTETRRAPAPRARTKHTSESTAKNTTTPVGATPLTVPAAAPALHERLKPLLNKGADMGRASE